MCDASKICRRSPPAENTQKKPPRLRQSASTGFDTENSPNRMVAAVHRLLIVKQDQTRLELITSKTASLSEADATWGRLPYLVNYAH